MGQRNENGVCLPRLPGKMLDTPVLLDSEKRKGVVGGQREVYTITVVIRRKTGPTGRL